MITKVKPLISLLAIASLASVAYAQNTFPSSGNVGIGTSAPGSPIDVADAPGTYPAGVKNVINVTSTGAGDAGGTTDVRGVNSTVTATGAANIETKAVSGNVRLNGTGVGMGGGVAGMFVAEQIGSGSASAIHGLHARINTTGSGNVNTAQGVQAYLIQTGTGNVTTWRAFNHPGITASGTGDVTGAIYIYGAGQWGRATATTAYCFNAEDATKGSGTLAAFRGNVSAATGKYNLYLEGTAQNYFAGNVGIGTTNPTQKLSVNGTIRAKEVIVETTGWPDYVFADNYKLVPLSVVEEQIKRDKRLPGLPSASDVAERGIGLGEMQAKLLAKIEELTLHQIEQEKQLKAQQIEIHDLRTRLESVSINN